MYFCSANAQNVANIPPDSITGAFSLLVEYSGAYGNGCKQTFTEHNPGITYIRRMSDISAGHWSAWEPISTATPPQEFNLPLAEPYAGNGKYLKTQENIVIVDVNIGTTGGSEISNNNMTFATLPAGFRPSRIVYSDAVTLNSTTGNVVGVAQISVDANGSLNLRVPSGSYRLRGELIFLAAD